VSCSGIHFYGADVLVERQDPSLISGVAHTEWKSRAFEVSDPSGFLPTIVSDTSE